MNHQEIMAIVHSDVRYKDWMFFIGTTKTGPLGAPVVWLQVRFETIDVTTGKPYIAHGRKWLMSEHMVKSEVIATALKAVLGAEEHEARELFKYKGKAIFNPHIDVEMLHAACDTVETRE